ncbi:unnamed protein product, partial [Ilex paraguariensis]
MSKGGAWSGGSARADGGGGGETINLTSIVAINWNHPDVIYHANRLGIPIPGGLSSGGGGGGVVVVVVVAATV